MTGFCDSSMVLQCPRSTGAPLSYKSEEELQGHLIKEQNKLLHPEHPPWMITVYRKVSMDGIKDNESAVFVRGHHAMCDATSLYSTIMPLLFDMELLPKCDPQFRRMWTRSEAGLTKVAREIDGIGCQSEPSALDLQAFRGGDDRSRESRKDNLRFTDIRQSLDIMLKMAVGYITWIFVAPYAFLM